VVILHRLKSYQVFKPSYLFYLSKKKQDIAPALTQFELSDSLESVVVGSCGLASWFPPSGVNCINKFWIVTHWFVFILDYCSSTNLDRAPVTRASLCPACAVIQDGGH
jgi:hypothetical protein